MVALNVLDLQKHRNNKLINLNNKLANDRIRVARFIKNINQEINT